MIELDELIPLCHRALTHARQDVHEQIAEALVEAGVVGVSGEPEVGCTTVVSSVVRSRHDAVRVDLDGVSGPGDIAWLVARGLAAIIAGPPHLSLLQGPAEFRSASTRRALLDLQEQLGMTLTDIALSDGPPDKDSSELLAEALGAVEHLASMRPLLVWVDHLEAPGLTPRHPVKVRELLWQLRAIRQRLPLSVLVSCRTPAVELAADRRAAFFGDGLWVTIKRPTVDVWEQVARDLARLGARGISTRFVNDLFQLAEGHPATMMLGLCERSVSGGSTGSAQRLMLRMASRDDGHTARAMQHARTLHRLGSQVLVEVAHGRKPYRQALGSRPQETNRALKRLHLAGLLTQPEPRRWKVTNPLVALRIRGLVPPFRKVELDEDRSLDVTDRSAANRRTAPA
ncbi:MAG: hypothetical protein LC777_03830 [Actinobacteria bacterium]|nr:hypothetical protein [Actinomycetota bacterium]